ncbi:MAG: 30S ribosome-binding factor RbfA [Simkaniaceae bacterium]
MATNRRVSRLNSLLKEVISEVIRKDVRNPDVPDLITVTKVEISKDLRHAKVYVSVIGSEEQREKTLAALQSAASFIAIQSSKKVVMRFFPELTFKLDRSVDHQMRIDSILEEIHKEQKSRPQTDNE